MPMMGFDEKIQKTDAGPLTGRTCPIACAVWFTSTGRIIPISIKWQDSDRSVHMLHNIHVLTVNEQNYCGIPSVEYDCEAVSHGRIFCFRLLYYVRRNEWKLWWKPTDEAPSPTDDSYITQ